jgi:inner membrane protein
MDSLTQLLLGTSVSVAVMGRRTAVWKAAVWGGVLGTLPDLDALIDPGDAVLNMVLHRAETHALFYLLLASAPLAWLISRLQGEQYMFGRWWLAVVMVLITHTLLDAMTVYGTQLALPFSNHAFGVGSLFIIDPAYTLPLLVGVIASVAWRTRGWQLNSWVLGLSTAYIGWSMVAQAYVSQHAHASLTQAGVSTQQVLVTPAPLSTLLWRIVAMDGDTYHEGFYALLDRGRPIRFTAHPSGQALLQAQAHHPHVQRLQAFNQGFMRARL